MVAEEFGAAFDETQTRGDQIGDGPLHQLRFWSLRLPDMVGWRCCRVGGAAVIGKYKTKGTSGSGCNEGSAKSGNGNERHPHGTSPATLKQTFLLALWLRNGDVDSKFI